MTLALVDLDGVLGVPLVVFVIFQSQEQSIRMKKY